MDRNWEWENPMSSARRKLLFLAIFLIYPQAIKPQQPNGVTLTEPGIFKLEDFFQMSDSVVLVKVISGDTESYPIVIYKAEVLRSFKGAKSGTTVYFGPYIGMRLGWEYILFLRSVAKPLAPNSKSTSNYGTVPYFEVLNQGYGAMETSYACIFGGKDISDECDDAVRVCTDYIKLPTTLPTFPPVAEETAFGCRLARKRTFLSLLEAISYPG